MGRAVRLFYRWQVMKLWLWELLEFHVHLLTQLGYTYVHTRVLSE